jgi:hypothetical protein
MLVKGYLYGVRLWRLEPLMRASKCSSSLDAKNLLEVKDARQDFFRISSSSESVGLRKSGKTYSEKRQDFFGICSV